VRRPQDKETPAETMAWHLAVRVVVAPVPQVKPQ
jgi:hypothetical protein